MAAAAAGSLRVSARLILETDKRQPGDTPWINVAAAAMLTHWHVRRMIGAAIERERAALVPEIDRMEGEGGPPC